MSRLTPPHRGEPGVSGSERTPYVIGGILPAKLGNKVSANSLENGRPLARLTPFHFHFVRRRFFARSLKTNVTSINCRAAPVQCESSATPPPATPPSVSSANQPKSVQPASTTSSEAEVINVNELYSRLLLSCGLRVAGAMALATVPALLLFKRPSLRTFLIGTTGGLVGGWQLYKADLVMRNPRENASLVPKAASLAECADEIQREWTQTATRFASFNWKNRT